MSTLQSLFHITSVIHRAVTGLDIVLTAVIQVGLITGSSEVILLRLASQLVCFSQQHSVHPSREATHAVGSIVQPLLHEHLNLSTGRE